MYVFLDLTDCLSTSLLVGYYLENVLYIRTLLFTCVLYISLITYPQFLPLKYAGLAAYHTGIKKLEQSICTVDGKMSAKDKFKEKLAEFQKSM